MPPRPKMPADVPDSARTPLEALRKLLGAEVEADVPAGRFRLGGQRLLLFRPEPLVDIQKHLEGTLGLSSKGFLYLAGERSGREGHSLFRDSLVPPSAPEGEAALLNRSITPLSLLGWGHFEVTLLDPAVPRFRVALENSPIAEAYGESKRPVCHLIAGWIAGMAERALGRDLLCDELACRSQGKPRCEFQLQPMPYA